MNCVLTPDNETDEPDGAQIVSPTGALTLFHYTEF